MSLTELRAEIDKKADEEIIRILESAKNEAQQILAQAKAKADALRKERSQNMTKNFEEEEKSRLAILRMDLRGGLLRTKQEWASRVLEQAHRRLEEMADSKGPEYRELLTKLILEGIASLKGNQFIVDANPRDLEIIKRGLEVISAKAAQIKHDKIQLETSELPKTILGGVVISSEDHAQQYNNTLDARLSAPQLTGRVYELLFGTVE